MSFFAQKIFQQRNQIFMKSYFYKLNNFHEPQSFRENSVANKIPRTVLHFIHNVVDLVYKLHTYNYTLNCEQFFFCYGPLAVDIHSLTV